MPPSLPSSCLSSIPKFSSNPVSIPIRTYIKSYPFVNRPSNVMRPESPQYVQVPVPPQSEPIPKKIIKGTLPPPRNIFHRRAADKTSEEFFEATIPEPEHARRSANDYVDWKRRMAKSRRRNLRESIADLYQRKMEHAEKLAAKSENRSNYREKLLRRAQREDERLTNPTITTANNTLQKGVLPDPNREARIAAKKMRVEAIEAARKDARKDALHTLYMNARNFITTDEELDTKIEEIFTPTPHEPGSYEDNIWVVKKAPPTVQDLLNTVRKEETLAHDYYRNQMPSIATGHRVKKIAEELTGGKID